jgi:hypothetical protein
MQSKEGLEQQTKSNHYTGEQEERWRSHKERELEKVSTYRRLEGLLTGEGSSPPEGEHQWSGEGHGVDLFLLDVAEDQTSLVQSNRKARLAQTGDE